MQVDSYVEDVIKRGGEGSALLAAKCAPTLIGKKYVGVVQEGMNGLVVFRIPDGFNAAVFAAHGDSHLFDPKAHAASMVDNIHNFAEGSGIQVLGFADMIDASVLDKGQTLVHKLGDAMAERANRYGYAITNGELAILGNQVACDANVSGVAVGLTCADAGLRREGGRFVYVFDPKGQALYLNSDGQGSKSEFNVRMRKPWLSLQDSLVMKADDVAKRAAEIVAMFDFVESNGDVSWSPFEAFAAELSRRYDFDYIVENKNVGDRLRPYLDGEMAINVGGSAVSTIDEKWLAKEGLYVSVEGLFPPDPRAMVIEDFLGNPPEKIYAKRPHGTEGFVATPDPGRAVHRINEYGLDAKVVGQLESARDGRTGVELAGIRASTGGNVYFPGI